MFYLLKPGSVKVLSISTQYQIYFPLCRGGERGDFYGALFLNQNTVGPSDDLLVTLSS